MLSLDILGGILLGVQVILYNRILPYYTTHALNAGFKLKVIGPIVSVLYVFNLIMLISSSARVYSGFKDTDKGRKSNHYSTVIASIVIVILFNTIAEILLVKYKF